MPNPIDLHQYFYGEPPKLDKYYCRWSRRGLKETFREEMNMADLTDRHRDFDILDMMGETDEELLKVLTPEELKEMKEYIASKESNNKIK